MSEYQNTHYNDDPRFEPWLGVIASSVLPLVAGFLFPAALGASVVVLSVLLFVTGLIMLRLQTIRRAREQNRGAKPPLVPMAQLQLEDR